MSPANTSRRNILNDCFCFCDALNLDNLGSGSASSPHSGVVFSFLAIILTFSNSVFAFLKRINVFFLDQNSLTSNCCKHFLPLKFLFACFLFRTQVVVEIVEITSICNKEFIRLSFSHAINILR